MIKRSKKMMVYLFSLQWLPAAVAFQVAQLELTIILLLRTHFSTGSRIMRSLSRVEKSVKLVEIERKLFSHSLKQIEVSTVFCTFA